MISLTQIWGTAYVAKCTRSHVCTQHTEEGIVRNGQKCKT